MGSVSDWLDYVQKHKGLNMLNIELIRIDRGTQSRVAINQETVDDYARFMEDGAKFPPITVFFDGVEYYLADGFHRYFANRKLKRDGIDADILKGTLREAILHSLKANKAHGLRPTIEDKRKTVKTMLTDNEWKNWSDREIARHCGVSHVFVAKMRKELGNADQLTRKFRTKNGNVTTRTDRTTPDPDKTAPDSEKPEYNEQQEMLQALVLENEKLSEQLAIATIDGTAEEKDLAQTLISDLKEEIKLLKVELTAVKKSRDMFQSENAQLKKQVAMLQKKLKAVENA